MARWSEGFATTRSGSLRTAHFQVSAPHRQQLSISHSFHQHVLDTYCVLRPEPCLEEPKTSKEDRSQQHSLCCFGRSIMSCGVQRGHVCQARGGIREGFLDEAINKQSPKK